MGIAGRVVGFLFFAALLVGALTSAISLLEVVVTSAIDELNVNRLQASIFMGGAITLLGIPPALDINVLGRMDAVAANLFLPVGGFALAIFVGWFMKDPLVEVSKGAEGIRWFFLWQWLLRIPVPVVLLFVIYESIKALAK
jgi:NSS family neurotransmitter:Na+ symporter